MGSENFSGFSGFDTVGMIVYTGTMDTTVTIKLPKREKERLVRIALRYGFSLPEFSRHILGELTATFPEESFADYAKPRALKASLERALRDWRHGRVRTRVMTIS